MPKEMTCDHCGRLMRNSGPYGSLEGIRVKTHGFGSSFGHGGSRVVYVCYDCFNKANKNGVVYRETREEPDE